MEIKETAEKYRLYTCDEVDSFDDGNRYELIDGKIYLMAPPAYIHQSISSKLHLQFGNFLKGKTCEVHHAGLAVYLNKNDNNRLEPDISVICDKSKISDRGYEGAPTLIIEILSPSNSSHDKVYKFNKYLESGVREYWIVDPIDKTVSVNILKSGEYFSRYYAKTDTIPVTVLEGCDIDLKGVFPEE